MRPIYSRPIATIANKIVHRDSEESAPAEYPPDQPEADTLDDDGAAYGAEEAEMQAALEKELEESEAKMVKGPANGNAEDKEMADGFKPKEEDEVSEAGSEDLEEESSDEDEDDEDDEEGAEGEDTEMADGEDKPTATVTGTGANGQQKGAEVKPEVMVH